jgi:5''-3'' exonuclease (including N-terminal domain of PolI)
MNKRKLLIDYSGFIYRSLFQLKRDLAISDEQEEIDINVFYRYLKDNLLILIRQFPLHFHELLLCKDGKFNWRNDVFPYYKQRRKNKKVEDKFDWKNFFIQVEEAEKELVEEIPCRFFYHEQAEGDDLIAIFAEHFFKQEEKFTVVSQDKDLTQLIHFYKNKQYDPLKEEFVKPKMSIIEHIARGDSADGIPNIFGDDDTYLVEGKRCPSITKKKVEEWESMGLKEFLLSMKDSPYWNNVRRNTLLIDLRRIPKEISSDVIKLL